jgi:hypothetical protein
LAGFSYQAYVSVIAWHSFCAIYAIEFKSSSPIPYRQTLSTKQALSSTSENKKDMQAMPFVGIFVACIQLQGLKFPMLLSFGHHINKNIIFNEPVNWNR